MNNYTPYEIGILLEVHCGMTITASRNVPLFHETMEDFIKRGLVRQSGYSYAAGEKLEATIAHVLNAPRPRPADERAALSPRQVEIMQFLKEQIDARGLPPTRSEIADHFGFKSANAAQEQLAAMEKKGYIKLGTARARSIRIIA